MKRFICIALVALSLCLCACGESNEVIDSIGSITEKEFYTHTVFQDYMDFGIYKFDEADLSENEYFQQLNGDNLSLLLDYIDDFNNKVNSVREVGDDAEFVQAYCFESSCLDMEDYIFIDDQSSTATADASYSYYTLYVFDTQTNTLYYFKNVN